MSTSLNIKTKYNDIEKSKAVPYINPNASNSELLAFAQAAIALTNQSYQSTDRIDKINIDTPETQRTIGTIQYVIAGGQGETLNKSNPVVTLNSQNAYKQGDNYAILLRFPSPYDGAAPLIQNLKTTSDVEWKIISYSFSTSNASASYLRNRWAINITGGTTLINESVTFNLHFNKTSEVAAYDLPITFIFTED